jgi:hypothetical protein
MSRLFGKRLREAERRAPKPEDELRLTKGLSERECAEIYGRILHGEPLESVFPGEQFGPDPEPLVEEAFDGLTEREATAVYFRLIHAKGRDESNKILHEQIARNRSRRT